MAGSWSSRIGSGWARWLLVERVAIAWVDREALESEFGRGSSASRWLSPATNTSTTTTKTKTATETGLAETLPALSVHTRRSGRAVRQIFIASLLLGWIANGAHAQSSLPVLSAAPSQIRIDGELGEWRGARFQRTGEDAAGSAEFALAHDEKGLFIGARIRDDVFVRSAQPNASEDALVVRLAFPMRGQFQENELWLFAGRIGKTAASAQLRASGARRPLREGVQIVEGPSPNGYALEAFVPWSAFEGGADWGFARGAVRLHDVDAAGARGARGAGAASLSTAKLPWLEFDGGPAAALKGFLRAKGLESTTSKLDFVGDVRSDARAERVLVVGSFVVVSGGGTQVSFAEFPVTSGADVQSAELRDLTGDGKPELAVRMRQQNELGKREIVRVYDLGSQAPSALFGAELRKQTSAGFVDAKLSFERGDIVLSAGKAEGLTADNYAETPAGELVPIPLPWGPWRERTYGWDGTRFKLKSERKNPTAQAPPTAAAPPPVAATPQASLPAPSAASLQPLEAYKRTRGVRPEVRARFVQSANLIGDARTEALAVFGRELVITGEGIGGDAGFFYLGLPVADAADVLGIQTGDLTGDGRRELLVRIRQRIGDVQRELLYCYGLGGERVQQLLAVEVSRARGAQRVDNQVALVADKQRMVLTIEPGTARGWSAADYPFVAESLDGIAPLLLPWKDHSTRYVFERDRLVPKARTSN